MFDEVDEGTAMFKVVARRGDLPAQGTFVSLDYDGQELPSDWSLRLTGAGGAMLRGDIGLTPRIPITPGAPAPAPTPSPTPTPTPSASQHTTRVAHGYLGILGREADAGGLAGYSAALASGALTLPAFCHALFDSPEFAQNRAALSPEELASELYRGILGREADPGGHADTAAQIRAGRRSERAADMLNSAEFTSSFLQ
jgi:hypothetical protein